MHYGLPVLFGVLTCNTLEQAIPRSGGNVGNKGKRMRRGGNKGVDCQPWRHLEMVDLTSRTLAGERYCSLLARLATRHPAIEQQMARRSRAREVALQVLYQDDLNPRQQSGRSAIEFVRSAAARGRADRVRPIGWWPACGAIGRSSTRCWRKTADNWSLERMAATDRNVLRLGAFEILYTDTPGRVAINEAVELAKRFGTAQSAQFVNGILDRLLAGHEKHE